MGENIRLKEALRKIGRMGCTKEGSYATDWALIAARALGETPPYFVEKPKVIVSLPEHFNGQGCA